MWRILFHIAGAIGWGYTSYMLGREIYRHLEPIFFLAYCVMATLVILESILINLHAWLKYKYGIKKVWNH
jgi:CDP-diglyceride synthetase